MLLPRPELGRGEKLPPAPEGITPYEFPINPAALKFPPGVQKKAGFLPMLKSCPGFFSPCVQKYDSKPCARGGKHPVKADREIRAPPLPSYSNDLINCCISHVIPVSSQISQACYLQMLLAERPATNPPKAPAIHKHIPQPPKPCKNVPRRISKLCQSPWLSIADPPGPRRRPWCQQTRSIIGAMGGEEPPNSISHSGNKV